MPEIKNTFIKGRMNLDLDERLTPNGEYREALNIEVSTSDDSDIGTVQNIAANQSIMFPSNLANSPGSNPNLICIGSISDEKNNCLYWFVTADITVNTGLSTIIKHDLEGTGSFTPVIIDTNNSVLQFNNNINITGINIVDDFLFFTDGVNEPKKINIKDFEENGHTLDFTTTSNFYVNGVSTGAVTKEDVTVIKKKPTKPPVVELIKTIDVDDINVSSATIQPFSFDGISVGDTITINFDLEMFVVVQAGAPNVTGDVVTYATYEDIAGNTYQLEEILDSNGVGTGSYTAPELVDNTGFGLGDFVSVRDAKGISFPTDSIIILSDPALPGSLPNNTQVRLMYNSKIIIGGSPTPIVDAPGNFTAFAGTLASNDLIAEVTFTVLSIDNTLPSSPIAFDYMIEADKEILFEKDFSRFAYRYKYKDGEYSAFGPFSQVAFEAGQFSIHPTREPYNTAMENNISKIILKDFVTNDIPKDVVEIDLLYKPENSNIIYSLDTIKPFLENGSSNPVWTTINGSTNAHEFAGNYIYNLPVYQQASDTGYYEITTDTVHAAIPSNQSLRLYDNVPKAAKAQDFTANRLIYGNYTQNLSIKDYDNNLSLNYESRSIDQTDVSDFILGLKSVKSQRTYQAGISFLDLYGRETPIFTSGETSTLKIPFNKSADPLVFDGNASKSNRLTIRNIPGVIGSNNARYEDPHFFKIFIKETSTEYYNLVLDRVYRAEDDGNLWLSFPSSDRNKIKEDDFIILKKQLNEDAQVDEENKFKVIDIKNEAPKFIRAKYRNLGEADGGGNLSDLFIDPSLQPTQGANKIVVSKEQLSDEQIADLQKLFDENFKLSIKFTKVMSSGVVLNSTRYFITSLTSFDGSPDYYSISLEKTIESQDSWVESSVGVLEPTLKIVFFKEEIDEWEEFQGRFFVKILSNITTAKYLEQQIGENLQQILSARLQLFALIDDSKYLANNNYNQGTVTNLSSTGISDARAEWQEALKFGGNVVTSGWFIDGMGSVAQQPLQYSTAPTGLTGPNVASNNQSALGSTTFFTHGNEFDVSASGNLFKAGPPSSLSIGWITNFIPDFNQSFPYDFTVYQNDGGPVDGVEGIFTADGQYNVYSTSAGRAWRKQPYGDFLDPVNNTLLYGEDVYGDSGSNGHYMHLSFAGVGVNLHNGNLPVDNPGNITDLYDHYAGNLALTNFTGGSYLIDLQNIENFNAQQNNRKKVCNVFQDYSNRDNEKVISQWDPIGRTSLNNFSQSNKVLIDNLNTGARFRFTNDNSNTIFTIKKVVEKRLYNHTAWNRRVVWDSTNNEYIEDTGTVHYAWADLAKELGINNGVTTNVEEKRTNLKNKLRDFGAKDNRRTMYVIELDKDPSLLLNPPDELAGPLTTVDSTFIEFLQNYVSDEDVLLSDNPAIFETEPKENVDLDIYHEVTQAYPLQLDTQSAINPIDNRKSYLIGSVHDIVRCTKEEYNIDINQQLLDTRVYNWNGDVVEINSGLTPQFGMPLPSDPSVTVAANNINHQTELLAGRFLQFHKTDGSYVEVEIDSVDSISTIDTINLTYSITKIKVKPIINKLGLSYHNCYSFGNGVESNRIRDDFNKPFVKNGFKVSTTLQEQYLEDKRTNSLIFSGLYNKSTSLNDLNQFIMAEKITKELEPTYGSIQKLFARDSDLIALCEDKIVQIYADKDAIFNADGNPQLIASEKVLGQSRPFVGEYGISKNPESFASSSYRAYFADKQRGAVLRLSMDGLTPISEAGMKDWFRDKFKGDYFNIIGSYDVNKDNYHLSFDFGNTFNSNDNFKSTTSSVTVTYKEAVKGWVSFKGFIQESGVSCVSDYFTFRNGEIWKHNIDDQKNNFYGQSQTSFVTAVFNNVPTAVKHFNTLNYDGQQGWFCQFINTDLENGSTLGDFINKENKYFATIVNDGLNENGGLDTSSFNFQGVGIADTIDYNI